MHKLLAYCFIIFILTLPQLAAVAQQNDKQDVFFLAKKKGLLGKLGKSISTHPDDPPQRVENPFLQYKGKIIRSIEIVRLGFECDINDSCSVKDNFGIRIGKKLHRNSTDKVIRRDLFFQEGSRVYPFLMADNERYLRDLVYLQDARILIDYSSGTTDSVDITVLTKDIFSLGGNLGISSKTRGKAELKDENINGSGSRLAISGFYDKDRQPHGAFGAEWVKRNIRGSFIDWTVGFQNFRSTFSSFQNEEEAIYTKIEKPLVTPYIPSTGGLEGGYFRTTNGYNQDSLYHSDYRYAYYNIDGWFGYSLDSKRALYEEKEIRVHRFAAIRGFYQHFLTVPIKYKTQYDYRYADFNGALASINVFRQVFYKTNFIYGFGRNEDVPEGFSVALTGGWVNKQAAKRPYLGLDAQLNNFIKNGYYTSYTFRAGGYYYHHRFEDVDLLFNLDKFTRLKKLNSAWFFRCFFSTGITAQVNPVLNAPLFLNSVYGLPYFDDGVINADLRTTVKAETVFYNTKKILGFRFAPFLFGDLSMLKPMKQQLSKSDLYSAVGGGVRTRNENLVFGTIELKGYYFPRVSATMNTWKIELNTDIRFKYNSTFIKRPDFVIAN
jgi:hypothetical protein